MSRRSVCIKYIHSNVLSYLDCVCLGVRLLRDTASLVDQQANDYIDTLQKLRRGLNDHPSISAAATIYRVFGKIEAIGRCNLSCNSVSCLTNRLFYRGSSTSKRGEVCGQGI